jgi:hypothetical protein
VLSQPWWATGRRFGVCFFGCAFFGAGAGLRVFFTGAILWKLMSASFSVMILQQFLYRSAAITYE